MVHRRTSSSRTPQRGPPARIRTMCSIHECLAAHPDAHARLMWDTRLPAGQTVYDLAPVLHYGSSGTWNRLLM
jgi:hypothetical protein